MTDQLRGLFLEMCQHAMSRYDETLEVGIFGQLLDNEESRIKYRSLQVDVMVRSASILTPSPCPQRQVTVRQSVAGRSTGSIVAEDRGKTSEHTRKESGYFSPDSRSRTPENVLETRWNALGVLNNYFIISRSSGSGSGLSLMNRRSDFFNNLNSEIHSEAGEVFHRAEQHQRRQHAESSTATAYRSGPY